jgi:hypothetical protein
MRKWWEKDLQWCGRIHYFAQMVKQYFLMGTVMDMTMDTDMDTEIYMNTNMDKYM